MQTSKEFQKQKDEIGQILKNILKFLDDGRSYGVKVEDRLYSKINDALSTKSNEKLKVALIGSFSSGKTSIAASWTGKYDKNTMKISVEESSDSVTVYSFDDLDLDIVDTPGLFGFKQDSLAEKYEDKTLNYISDAHIILFVVKPSNPIPSSQKETLVKLFAKDKLNLLPRTVFVVNRFDEIVDICDKDDYEAKKKILRDNIENRILEFGIEHKDPLSVVAVSASPYSKGIEHWLQNLDELNKISHLDTLQDETLDIIKKLGGNEQLALDMQKSVVSDILISEFPKAKDREKEASEECEKLLSLVKDINKDKDKMFENIQEASTNLKEFILTFYTDLILKLGGTSIETFNDFFERNIGKDAIVLEKTIQRKFEKEIDIIDSDMLNINRKINNGVSHYNDVMGMLFKDVGVGVIKNLSNSVTITAEGIKVARDVIMSSLKFKPWQAINIANTFNKCMPLIGPILDLFMQGLDSYKKAEEEQKFQDQKTDIEKSFVDMRKKSLAELEDKKSFIDIYFPEYKKIENNISELSTQYDSTKKKQDNFREWLKQANDIKDKVKGII